MERTNRESPEPSLEEPTDVSMLETLDSAQSRVLTISSLADLLSSVSPDSTLNTQTLPTLGSFLLEECGHILLSLESLHETLASFLKDRNL